MFNSAVEKELTRDSWRGCPSRSRTTERRRGTCRPASGTAGTGQRRPLTSAAGALAPCHPRELPLAKQRGAGVAGEVHLDEASAHEHEADGDPPGGQRPSWGGGAAALPARRARHCLHRGGCGRRQRRAPPSSTICGPDQRRMLHSVAFRQTACHVQIRRIVGTCYALITITDVRQFGGKLGFIEANAAPHPSKRPQAQAHPSASLAANPETRSAG